MSGPLAHVGDAVLNTPLLLHPGKLAMIAAVLDGRIGIDAAELRDLPGASRFVGSAQDPDRRGGLPFMRTEDGVAIITVAGSLVNRGAWIGASSGMVSYEGLNHQVSTAADDNRVRAILLDLESPGGAATGAFEAAENVRAAAAKKPVTAVVNGMAASAAYAIASAASRIVTTPTGVSGSIGVVMLHADRSEMLAKAGIKPTLIHAGAKKVDANPFQPLTADVRADLQAEIDHIMSMFVDCVAKGRRGLSAEAIRATEAAAFIGAEAVKAGLADAVGTFDGALADLTSRAGLRRTLPSTKRTTMSTSLTDDDERAVRADERARIKTITGCDEAKGRSAQALALAVDTGLTVDEAKAVLAASPKVSSSSLAARMEASEGPNLGHEAPSMSRSEEISKGWDEAYAKARKGVA